VVGIFFLQVIDGCLEGEDAVYTISLIKGKIGLVSDTIRCCRVDDEGVKLAKGTENIVFSVLSFCLVDNTLGDFVQVSIQTYAEKRLLLADLCD